MTWKEKITEKVIHRVKELGDEKNVHLREDLIEDAFTQIMIYSQANSYHREWDSILVTCVVTLYNYLGVEGSTQRMVDGISDTYTSSDILAPIISRNIKQYIKPSGYVYSNSRFDMPED